MAYMSVSVGVLGVLVSDYVNTHGVSDCFEQCIEYYPHPNSKIFKCLVLLLLKYTSKVLIYIL